MVNELSESRELSEALFRTSYSRLLRDATSFGVGAAMEVGRPGWDVAVEPVMRFGSKRSTWPDWVLASADADGVHLFASDGNGSRGHQVLTAPPGTFRAKLHRTLGQVHLMLSVPGLPTLSLRSQGSFRTKSQMRLAQAVVGMAQHD